MRKVLIATPSYDGKVEAIYCNSLVETLRMAPKDILICPVFICYDALVQRARNDLVKMALETDCDDIIFIDGDQGWNPEWVFKLLEYQVDVVGGAVVKKSEEIDFNVKALPNIEINENGLMEVECVGTGFLRISKQALKAVSDASTDYKNNGTTAKLVFDIKIVDGELVSEDNVFCQKWRDLGGQVWVDPAMTCSHVGVKCYTGNLLNYLQEIDNGRSNTD